MNRRLLLLILTAALVVSCKRSTQPTTPIVITIDPEIGPVPAEVPDDGKRGPRPVAAIRDEAGVETEFFANEVIIVPRSQSELDQFIAKYKGKIIGDNSVPEPPPSLGKKLEASETKPTEYVVRIDASGVDYKNLTGLTGPKLGGNFTASSEDAARLLVVTVRESANGLSVSPNFIQHPQGVLLSTREQQTGPAAFDDAFNISLFPRFQPGGSRANVTAAWQWVAAHGIVRRINVAVIDGGFWLNAAGQPNALGGIDFAAAPIQYDFVNDDFIAGAMNPAACSGGSPCPWHGNGSAGVAGGFVNNSAVAAGTGGTVVNLWLFQADIRDKGQRDRAVRTAARWGADIVSMSFSGKCNIFCQFFEELKNNNQGYNDVLDRGGVLVASAGNDTNDVDDDDYYPCIGGGVICVGALANETNMRDATYSNYGSSVDIWAPSNVRAITGGTNAAPVLTTHGGTSASAPFISGVAAMVKAINPSLNSDQVRDLLRDTAWTDSPDGDVSHYVNALAAVKRASNGTLPPDGFESNETPATAKAITVGQHDNLTIHAPSDRDFYKLTVAGAANVTLTSTYSDMLGKPYVNFSKTDDCGGATQISSGTKANQQTWTYSVTPGQYLVQVSSGSVLPYDFGIASAATALTRDGYEGLVNNDVISRAFPLGKGGGMYSATMFPAGDVDVYQIQSTGGVFNPKVGGTRFFVSVVAADMPVSLDLYNDKQALIKTVDTSPDCKSLSRLELPAGTFYVRARAASQGSYVLAVGAKHDSGILYDMRSLWRLLQDPSGPVQFLVDGPYDRFVYQRGQERAGSINVTGSGLHATLLDSSGNIIAEGQPFNTNGQISENIPLTNTIAGESYVVRLDRDIGAMPAKGTKLPRVIANLSLR